jgi:hypothetical protein
VRSEPWRCCGIVEAEAGTAPLCAALRRTRTRPPTLLANGGDWAIPNREGSVWADPDRYLIGKGAFGSIQIDI